MKFTEIQIGDIAFYLKIVQSEQDFEELTDREKMEIGMFLDAAREFIRSQTGLNDEKLDNRADIVVLAHCLCQHMYDNRCFVIEKSTLNPMMQDTLKQYGVDLVS